MDAAASSVFDRAAEDPGNIVELGHVNVRVPDQQLATLFYVAGLGLTRDPYLMTGVTNMWINVGRSQFHLPTGRAQVVAGHTALVVPDREALLRRLAAVGRALAETRFAVRETAEFVEATCPWGNRIRCFAPAPRFGAVNLGIAHVELAVPAGTAPGILSFYRDMLGARAEAGADGRHVRVAAGPDQYLILRETDGPLPAFDGAHVQITLHDFSGPHARLLERGLISEESDQHQWRFQNIIDPSSGRVLAIFEHEVRSVRHPLHARPLVNRDPEQTTAAYVPGRDAWVWSIGRA
jgi:catechol 2,3-dioxygenase-like lactoylglutathione lyase family enzyme